MKTMRPLVALLLVSPALAANPGVYANTPEACGLFKSGGLEAVKASPITAPYDHDPLVVTPTAFAGPGYVCSFPSEWSRSFEGETSCGPAFARASKSEDLGGLFFENNEDFAILHRCD